MRRKTTAGAMNVPAVLCFSWPNPKLDNRSRGRTVGLDDICGERSSAVAIAIEAMMRLQPRSVNDMCKLRLL
jgi:hypothetical protein